MRGEVTAIFSRRGRASQDHRDSSPSQGSHQDTAMVTAGEDVGRKGTSRCWWAVTSRPTVEISVEVLKEQATRDPAAPGFSLKDRGLVLR